MGPSSNFMLNTPPLVPTMSPLRSHPHPLSSCVTLGKSVNVSVPKVVTKNCRSLFSGLHWALRGGAHAVSTVPPGPTRSRWSPSCLSDC